MIELGEGKNGGLPLYETVRQRLKADLDRGRWKPGEMLPTEAEMSRHFGVSVGTVRQAVLSLVRLGLLTRRPGKGTFVTRLDSTRGFARFFRFHDALGAEITPTVKHIDTIVLKDPEIASRLGIPAKTGLVCVRRILMWDESPVCLYVSYLDKRTFKGLEKLNLEGRRLYAALEEDYGVHVTRTEEHLRAGHAASDEAELLGVEKTTPVMLLERTAYSHEGAVVEWRRTTGRSDRFYYKIDLP